MPFPCVNPVSPYSTSQLVSLPFEVQLKSTEFASTFVAFKLAGTGQVIVMQETVASHPESEIISSDINRNVNPCPCKDLIKPGPLLPVY